MISFAVCVTLIITFPYLTRKLLGFINKRKEGNK